MREHTGPVALLAERIPRRVLEDIYGIKIEILSKEEGGTGVTTAEELLIPYAGNHSFISS